MLIEAAAFAIFGVGCTSIGIASVTKREIKLTGSKVWRGKSTLLLGIPLLIIGVLWFAGAAYVLL